MLLWRVDAMTIWKLNDATIYSYPCEGSHSQTLTCLEMSTHDLYRYKGPSNNFVGTTCILRVQCGTGKRQNVAKSQLREAFKVREVHKGNTKSSLDVWDAARTLSKEEARSLDRYFRKRSRRMTPTQSRGWQINRKLEPTANYVQLKSLNMELINQWHSLLPSRHTRASYTDVKAQETTRWSSYQSLNLSPRDKDWWVFLLGSFSNAEGSITGLPLFPGDAEETLIIFQGATGLCRVDQSGPNPGTAEFPIIRRTSYIEHVEPIYGM